MTCEEMAPLLEALLDGELDAVHAARAETHLAGCPACSAKYEDLRALRTALRADPVRERAPARLHARLNDLVGTAEASPTLRPIRPRRVDPWWTGVAGFAAAACLALFAVVPALQSANLEHELVASHVRAQLASHLTDVATSDQHVVKPWFGGKIDFSPPVVELASDGFPLVGGRLDYIGGRVVPAIVYRRGRHVINLFVWPERGGRAPAERSQDGYTLLNWTQGGMTFWAVSDVNKADLATFEKLLQAKT